MNIKLPKRSDSIYKEIEQFKDYEFTNCITYEMAIRNEEVVNIKSSIDELLKNIKIGYTEVKQEEIKKLNQKLILNYWIRYIFEEDILKYPIKGTFNKMSINYKLFSEVNKDISINSLVAVDRKTGKGVEINDFYNENIEMVFVSCNKKINLPRSYKKLIVPDRIYKETNISLNFNLPENELIAYIKELKFYHDENNFSGLDILYVDLYSNIEKSDNKKINKKLIADKFFIYDYIKARQEEIKNDNELNFQEYKEEVQNIKNNHELTRTDKEIQLKELKKEFEENTNTRINELFKDEDIKDFAPATAKRYYYDIKPFIDDCKYKELITGIKQ